MQPSLWIVKCEGEPTGSERTPRTVQFIVMAYGRDDAIYLVEKELKDGGYLSRRPFKVIDTLDTTTNIIRR